jgi:hypothetical protein
MLALNMTGLYTNLRRAIFFVDVVLLLPVTDGVEPKANFSDFAVCICSFSLSRSFT